MSSKFKIIFWIFFLLSISALFVLGLKGQELLPSKNIIINSAAVGDVFLKPDCHIEENLIDLVESGKKLLESAPNLRYEKIERRKNFFVLNRRQIRLSIVDTETCEIFERLYWLNEDDIQLGSSLRRNYLDNPGTTPEFIPENSNDSLKVLVRWWNSFNSDLVVVDPNFIGPSNPAKYIILANKYLLSNDSFAYPQEVTGKEYSDIVYSPYSKEIHYPVLVESGRKTLSDAVDEVFEDLKNSQIKSQAFPGTLVTDLVSSVFVKNLLITEQVDPSTILSSLDGGLNVSERVLVRYGLNGERSFHFTYSKTGASGAGQIMPGTYNSIVRAYPSAKLIRDTDIGRVDFKNGIKATFLILDDHFATVVRKASSNSSWRKIFSSLTKLERDVIMAGIYNGGPGKYVPSSGKITNSNKETADFIKKFSMIRDLHLFD